MDNRRKIISGVAGAVLAASLLTGCSSIPPEDPEDRLAWEEANDPWEDYNRYMFELNYAIDQLVLRPIAGWYRVGVPEPLRDAIRNVLRNARTPLILLHDLFQGELDRARQSLLRFLTNTTLGVGGFIDVADWLFDIPYHNEDAGQTMGAWGFEEGWYIVLPLLGPSNPRDMTGIIVDTFIDPVGWALRATDSDAGPVARSVLTFLDLRSRNIDTLDELEKTSIDYYATVRSLYRQRRRSEINNGRVQEDQLFDNGVSDEGAFFDEQLVDESEETEESASLLDSPAFEDLDAEDSAEAVATGFAAAAQNLDADADGDAVVQNSDATDQLPAQADLKTLVPMLAPAAATPAPQPNPAIEPQEVRGLPWRRDQQAQLPN